MVEKLNKTVMDLFHQYHNSKCSESKKKKLKALICANIQELYYFMPQEKLGLSEEDCAEFMIQMLGKTESIFAGYIEDFGDFTAYIYPIMDKAVRGFRMQKTKYGHYESSILFSHAAYEFTMNEMENSTENLIASESLVYYDIEENKTVKRMKAFFYRSPMTRKRFFVFFISYSVLMNSETIVRLCNTFNYNLEETLKIVNYLKENTKDRYENINCAIEKRNEYFSKQLILENELEKLNFFADHSKDEQILSMIERTRKYSRKKDLFIKSQQRRVPRSFLMKIFRTRESTIGAYMMFSGNLIEWCNNPETPKVRSAADIGVNKQVLDEVRGIMDFKSEADKILTPFSPVEKFRLTTALNS